MKKSLIKLILLDGYGVLMSRGYPDTEAVLAKRFGVPLKRLHAVLYTKWFNRAAERKCTQAGAWQGAIDELHLPLTRQALAALHLRLFKARLRELAFARWIRTRVPVVMLSKNTRTQFTATKRKLLHVWKSVDAAINTWELGLPKASPKTIRLIAKRFRVRPEEILYVDDQADNLVAPRQMGVRTILYRNYRQFRRDALSFF